MRQALSRKATPEILAPGDARGSPAFYTARSPRWARRTEDGAAGDLASRDPRVEQPVADPTLHPRRSPRIRVAALAAARTALAWERWSAAPRPLVSRDILFENVGPRFMAPRGWSGRTRLWRVRRRVAHAVRDADSASASWEPHRIWGELKS